MRTIPKITFPFLFAVLLAGGVAAHAGGVQRFDMTIEEVELEVAPGLKTKVWAYNGQVPGPLLHVREGDTVEVNVYNNTTISHTIHWHGQYQTGTWQSDGVPDVTQKAIEPGESYVYRFVAEKTGSLWYHCHVNVPEHVGLRGMWGPVVVEPRQPAPVEAEVTKDAVLFFSGWSSETAGTYGEGGHPAEVLDYFSINGKSFPFTEPLRVRQGDVLRLRLYAVNTHVSFHPHGHDMLVTHKDGLPLEAPYAADTVALSPGERLDVIIRMDNPGLWIAHDHIEHHVSNAGKAPGGAVLMIEYEEIEKPDWYVWKDRAGVPDFFFSESLAKPHGLHEVEAFKGTAPVDETRPRRRKKND